MQNKIGIDQSKCSACKICEIFCAAWNTGTANPKKAHIKVINRFPEPEIQFLDSCNLCAFLNVEIPICVKYCNRNALVLREES
ncbi:MAG: hypothetical protein ACUVXA_16440 [Candidatus Jordarchaeum sp.]|uniref:hypothetical protein n=1 Tax=Candidatus Jordarchaeum sp. TaxID=2823881 RepID=UPI004048F718